MVLQIESCHTHQQDPCANASNNQATSSKQQAASSKQQAASSKQQAASNKQQATSNKQQAASNKQQATTKQQQAASNKQQATTKQQQPSNNQAAATKQQPSSSNQAAASSKPAYFKSPENWAVGASRQTVMSGTRFSRQASARNDSARVRHCVGHKRRSLVGKIVRHSDRMYMYVLCRITALVR
jgi:hypothetical protein